MPRNPDRDKPDRNFPADHSVNNFDAEIAKVFESPPPGLDEFSDDSLVRTRMGALIDRSLDKPKRSKR
jgi:hypothetical protein